MNDLILVESKAARQQMIGKCSVLDKVKALPYLTKDMRSTIQQAAAYYGVPEATVHSVIKRNRDEFEDDGIEILRGKELKKRLCDVQDEHRKLCEGHNVPSKTRNLTLLPKRAVLRLGMLLTESEVAKLVRNYLLNLEEVSTQDQKEWSLEREVSKARRRFLTDAIDKFIPESPNKHWKYKHFTELAYKTSLGKATKDLKAERCCKNSEQLRDKLDTEELKKVEFVESALSGLIAIGMDYSEIKNRLTGANLLTGT